MPGRTVLASRMPSPTDTIEITRQKPTVRTPTRPRRRTSPMPATPTMSEETTSGTTVISSERRNSWPAGSAMCLTTQVNAVANQVPAARAPTPPSVAPAASPSRMRTCSGIRRRVSARSSVCSSRSETTSRSNGSMWRRRFYSAVGRNNMSAKHGRHQGSPQPESARSPHDTARGAARERSASSPDVSKLRKNSGCPGSRKQPRRPVVPLPRLRRSVALVGRPLVEPRRIMSETRIGWVGTGVMGVSMCGHLMAKGYPTTIYSRTKSRAQSLLDKGATWADTPGAVAERIRHHLHHRRTAERCPRGLPEEGRHSRHRQERQRRSST